MNEHYKTLGIVLFLIIVFLVEMAWIENANQPKPEETTLEFYESEYRLCGRSVAYHSQDSRDAVLLERVMATCVKWRKKALQASYDLYNSKIYRNIFDVTFNQHFLAYKHKLLKERDLWKKM